MSDDVELKYQLKRLFRIGLFTLKVLAVVLLLLLLLQVFRAYRSADRARLRYQELQQRQEQLELEMSEFGYDPTLDQDLSLYQATDQSLSDTKVAEGQLVSGEQKYQVKAGDSTWKIAERFYGRGDYYPLIEKANNLKHNQWLEIGQSLTIPQLDQVEGEKPDNAGKNAITTGRASGFGPTYQPTGKTHLVVKGESLWTITAKEADDPYYWPQVYAANKSTIGNNPNLIYPGMVLKL
ncbi:MAG: LysM peptidoglycan-binding domain-containing protein [Patescibacteria group bacterium]